jgi:general secretion pathway protein G
MNRNETPNFLHRMMAKRNEGGFTLIELLIVIIILAILAAIVVFAVGNTGANAAAASCQTDAKATETALEEYKAANAPTFTYPTADNWAAIVPKYMRTEPSQVHYIIAFDGNGDVSANKITDGTGYLSQNDIDNAQNGGVSAVCTANAG